MFWRASSFSALLAARSSKGAFGGFLVSAMSSLTFWTGLDARKLSCLVQVLEFAHALLMTYIAFVLSNSHLLNVVHGELSY